MVATNLTCPEGCQLIVSFPLAVIDKPRVLIDGKKEIPENVEQVGKKDGRLLYRVTGPASMQLGIQNVP